jgi:hypothetical protein
MQAVKAAAAIEVATPISAMQPPSAALMDARFLQSIPIAAAVNKNCIFHLVSFHSSRAEIALRLPSLSVAHVHSPQSLSPGGILARRV